jgi:hypothetical protein
MSVPPSSSEGEAPSGEHLPTPVDAPTVSPPEEILLTVVSQTFPVDYRIMVADMAEGAKAPAAQADRGSMNPQGFVPGRFFPSGTAVSRRSKMCFL